MPKYTVTPKGRVNMGAEYFRLGILTTLVAEQFGTIINKPTNPEITITEPESLIDTEETGTKGADLLNETFGKIKLDEQIASNREIGTRSKLDIIHTDLQKNKRTRKITEKTETYVMPLIDAIKLTNRVVYLRLETLYGGRRIRLQQSFDPTTVLRLPYSNNNNRGPINNYVPRRA
ncbi:Hypothetical protein CINCED_3A002270 [Cinara cedri]|uniref:Uncharacterized protein n=1 Tax=Cinara cedri TaxID=506608 RepID=A0A5E4NTI0_9HEMI|nr:Hypothetical protein CINCED_3A002270 [Cinara cedri]